MRTKNELDAVKLECLNLLIVFYTYLETIRHFDPNKSTRFELHRWWIQLRSLENDMIIRLCRLDDDDKTNHSLREALRHTSLSQDRSRAIDDRLKKYRRLINPIKTKARNYYLAHLSKNAEPPYDPQGGLEKPIEEVVNIVDMLAGEPVSYTLRVGSQERELNLRDELSGRTSKH